MTTNWHLWRSVQRSRNGSRTAPAVPTRCERTVSTSGRSARRALPAPAGKPGAVQAGAAFSGTRGITRRPAAASGVAGARVRVCKRSAGCPARGCPGRAQQSIPARGDGIGVSECVVGSCWILHREGSSARKCSRCRSATTAASIEAGSVIRLSRWESRSLLVAVWSAVAEGYQRLSARVP